MEQSDSKQRRCVWMTAGVIRYKLCDRDFDCENCPFHQVMCGQELQEEVCDNKDLVSSYMNHFFRSCIVSPRHYTDESHLWFTRLAPKTVLVGLDPFCKRVLEPLKKIAIPDEGELLKQGQLAALAVRPNMAVPFYTPFGGRVGAHKRHESNEEGNALFALHVDKDTARFVEEAPPDSTLNHYEHLSSQLRAFLSQAVGHGYVGMTMADGGAPEDDLNKVLGDKRYRNLLEVVFRNTFF